MSCELQQAWIIPEDIKTEEEASAFMKTKGYDFNDSSDNWLTPETAYYSDSLDCEDSAGLLAHIFIYKLGYKDVRMIGTLVGGIPHMLVYHDGKYYEGKTGQLTMMNQVEVTNISYELYIFLARIK
jgi:hypothetical protein